MLRSTIAIAVALAAAGASAAPGGKLGTLPQGRYVCSMPGDATGPAWRVIPDGGFTIETALPPFHCEWSAPGFALPHRRWDIPP